MTGGKKLGRVRVAIIIISLLVIGLSWLMVLGAGAGLVIRPLTRDGIPMTYIGPAYLRLPADDFPQTQPDTSTAEKIPGVIIAHGFSGSKEVMRGFAFVLAHAGYGTLLFDFNGHAANPHLFGPEGDSLQTSLDAAYAVLLAQPEIDRGRIALLGHSMGSSAVMTAGIANPERYLATIAISPTDAAVTPTEPRNLLLQAGQLELPFILNAKDLLNRAGGPNADFGVGRARSFQLVPAAEHITILFNPLAHNGALSWLNQTFGMQRQTDYVDTRMIWYLIQLAVWLILATAVTPRFRFPKIEDEAIRHPPWHIVGMLIAPLAATAGLVLLNLFLPVGALGGMLMAGAVGLWFWVAGLVWLGLGLRPLLPAAKSFIWGSVIFAYLWLAFGLMAQVVWLPWLLIPARLLRWPLLALALFPAMLAAGWAQQGSSTGGRVGWWLGQSMVWSGGLLTAVFLIPDLFFLVLILPLLPIVIGLMAIVGGAVDDPWAYGLGNALFFSWLLVAMFPRVS